MAYQGLQFSFAEMHKEIVNMKRLAQPFLDSRSFYNVIPEWQRQLEYFERERHPSGAQLSWSISENDPVKTEFSEGEYEAKPRKGNYKLYGCISGVWQISKPPSKGKKKAFRSPYFTLQGLASTKIVIWTPGTNGADIELARWTLEVGGADSPGCHFHTQINLDHEDHKFPSNLPVPRLPAVLVTPMDALDFLLAELFHDTWYEHTSRETDPVKQWRVCQGSRLGSLLNWQGQKIREATGSPWTTFKRQKPSANIFYSG
ncbi:MAG: hypothetical protein ACREQA_06240 [Candidatus Binatia bacterium]